ncbi:MAG: insulinase family protein [Ignavibacteriales bacterium]|nr:insulinase family protein [Ignavibacteriales bacterium]
MKTTISAILCTLLLMMTTMTTAEQRISNKNLVLLPIKNDPTVSFRIWFKVGSQNDPAGKEGLANITAQMLTDASTQKNSYEQILNKLYPLAAGYSAPVNVEMTVITGRTHKDNLNDYYPLFMDAILQPAFKQDDLDRIKSQVLNFLENTLRYASDEELGKAILYNDIFEATPYGHITAGTIEAVKSITLDDIREFYKKYYTKDNLVIGLGGGYDMTLIDNLKIDLAKLPGGVPRAIQKPKANPIDGFDVTIVEKDAPATAISMGFPINVQRGTKDWYALAIATSWLGEHRNSSSHLYQVIREVRGLNYGDYAYIENFPNGGRYQLPPQNVCRRHQIFEIWLRPVPNETRHFALRAALREFKKLVENGLTEDQFNLTKKFLRNYILHFAPTTMERLGYAIDDKFYNIRGSHLEMYRKMMNEIKLEDVNAAIKKHWQFKNMKIAVITKDAQSFKDALVNDAPSSITYKTPKPESVLEEDKEINVFPLKVSTDNVKIVQVGDLFVR